MGTVHHVSSKSPTIFRLTFTKLEGLEKLHPLKINCKLFITKAVVLHQVFKGIEAKIQV